MKCLIDTNILISASLYPDSIVAQAYMKAVTHPYHAIVCDYSMDELRRVYNRKFPNKLHIFERFLSLLLLSVEVVFTPPKEESYEIESKIRDIKDRPILRAAIAANVDLLLTGDKDFIESGITCPRIITVTGFMQL